MGQVKKQKDAKEQTFKRLFGVNSEISEKMKSIRQNEYELHEHKSSSQGFRLSGS
jgi:formyltetrahydrofolate synthetase